MSIKRIIPVSSGKGGVGKTTFAINFALTLSQFGRTVLLDLDTGTSAVRNAINVPVEKDLYHFFKRNEPLGSCITPLDRNIDPQNRYPNFGFIAAPLHLIEHITNFGAERKTQLIHAINSLDAEYIVIDLKAGLDSNVIDFLPFSNSGILIFTPHLPSATLAASDIVKAILFRKLRLIFGKHSPFYETVSDSLNFFKLINDLIDRVEDVYDSSVPNLDAFVLDLVENLGPDHPIAKTVQQTVETFRVNYVLNLFSGVEESYDTAVRPFIENLTRNVSSRCGITNLGWITRSEVIHQANCNRIPPLLVQDRKDKPQKDRYAQELEDLRITAIGLEPVRKKPVSRHVAAIADPSDHLSTQLNVLKTMFETKKADDFRANFEYTTQRALFTMKTRTPSEFGDVRIYTPHEMLKTIFAKTNA